MAKRAISNTIRPSCRDAVESDGADPGVAIQVAVGKTERCLGEYPCRGGIVSTAFLRPVSSVGSVRRERPRSMTGVLMRKA
jgi:hypothetical protein